MVKHTIVACIHIFSNMFLILKLVNTVNPHYFRLKLRTYQSSLPGWVASATPGLHCLLGRFQAGLPIPPPAHRASPAASGVRLPMPTPPALPSLPGQPADIGPLCLTGCLQARPTAGTTSSHNLQAALATTDPYQHSGSWGSTNDSTDCPLSPRRLQDKAFNSPGFQAEF